MTTPNFIINNSEKFIDSLEFHNEVLQLNRNQYSRNLKEWLNSEYLFQSENEFRTPILNKDFSTPMSKSTGGRPTVHYLISIELSKLIAINSDSKIKKEYVQYLLSHEKKRENLDYLTPDEIIQLTYYKEFFKFVEKQLEYEKKHKSKFFIENTNKFLKKNQNPYIEFNVWRNKILEIEPQKIDSLIKEYCIENQKNIKNFNKHQKLNLLDNHLGLRNAVWDFLTIKGEINALKLANLVKRMADAENLTIYKKNENNLFQQKENINELKILNK